MVGERTDSQCCQWAEENEPARIPFWRAYYPGDYAAACRAVCDNPPSFDTTWAEEFPTPDAYFAAEREWERQRASIMPSQVNF
jgi:hypothetical protein